MAEQKKSRFRNLKVINNTLQTINTVMNGIYKSTYNTDRTSADTIERVSQDIEDNISSIMSKNNISDYYNVSKLYARLQVQNAANGKEFKDAANSFFEDPALTANVLSMYTENRWIRDLDIEIDTVLRYMPKLQEALQAKKENVLSSDNFSKDFLNESSSDISDKTDQAIFASRLQDLKEKYKLQEFYDETYDRVAKYGEEFIYCVPYSEAISTLLKRKENTKVGMSHASRNTYGGVLENGVLEIPIIENNVKLNTKNYEQVDKILKEKSEKSDFVMPENFKIIIDKRGFLESAYNEQNVIQEHIDTLPSSIYEAVLEAGGSKNFKMDISVPDELELPKDFDKTSSDGFITTSSSKTNVKTTGCVLKRLKHENVIPIYIDTTCLGYYYIEFLAGSTYDVFVNNDHIYGRDNIGFTGYHPEGRNFSNEAIRDQRNQLLSYFASSIAKQIDSTFVNTNQDLTKEIYTILKFNDVFNSQSIDSIRISFLPTSDVEHIYFRQDPDTHRGISDLMYALIPAKLYACLYITNTLGTLTRGHDKRVYYVKQNVEQNIAGTMLNVINQIKRGNFGMREIENMNTILNITGRFNDYVIPIGPSGDPPVQFEVMQGQEFHVDNDLMDRLEEMAVNSTDMPIEFIQNRMQSLDFAVQATTVNAKVLRSTYKRQSQYEFYMSRIQTKLYNTEYNENITITCSLPTPLFLHMTNINQMIDNTRTFVQSIADFEYEAESATNENADAEKAKFIRNMMRRKLSSYVKINEIEELKKLSKLELAKEKEHTENP